MSGNAYLYFLFLCMLDGNIRGQLLDTFRLSSVTLQQLMTSGFHRSIAHSFSYLEMKIQIDKFRMPMTSQNIHSAKDLILDTKINSLVSHKPKYLRNVNEPQGCATSGCQLEALKCTETYETLGFQCPGCLNHIEFLNYKNELIKYKSCSSHSYSKGDDAL